MIFSHTIQVVPVESDKKSSRIIVNHCFRKKSFNPRIVEFTQGSRKTAGFRVLPKMNLLQQSCYLCRLLSLKSKLVPAGQTENLCFIIILILNLESLTINFLADSHCIEYISSRQVHFQFIA